MSKILCLSISMVLLFALLLSGTAFAQDKNVAILFVNLNANAVAGVELPAVLLAPAGYTNTTTVTTVPDLAAALVSGKYEMVITSYHAINASPDMKAWLASGGTAILEAWIKSGGMFISTIGRDTADEQPLADAFGLKVSDPGTGTEAIVPVKAPFNEGIEGSQLDASTSTDNTPQNGQVYDDPLPSWAMVVTTNLAGLTTSVVGRYGSGAIWAGAGLEITNIGTGIDADESMFKGYKQLWQNVLDWMTTAPSAVTPADKASLTWGAIKNR